MLEYFKMSIQHPYLKIIALNIIIFIAGINHITRYLEVFDANVFEENSNGPSIGCSFCATVSYQN